MSKLFKNCFILSLNLSLEFENAEVHSVFYLSNVEQRHKLKQRGRKLVNDKVNQFCEFK